MIHIPILRDGKPYKSLTTQPVPHFQTGKPVAQLSIANRGLIARDLMGTVARKQALEELTMRELLEICKTAAGHFSTGTLPLGDDRQSAEDYIDQLSSTSGMPKSLCWKNMAKITHVLENMEAILGGLTRGLDLRVLDRQGRELSGRPLDFICETDVLGAVLPSNSPGVHSLWVQALAMKVPVFLKPGSQEPWSPYRIAQAFYAAGLPESAIGFYPTSHDGAAEILLRSGRSMLFGDKNTVAPWKHDRRVQIHGPGWSKLIIARDKAGEWQNHLDVIEDSVVANGGRSCINASGVWVADKGREIADALAKRFAKIDARAMDDPDARISAFTNKKLAYMLDQSIDRLLRTPGAEDLTAQYRSTRLVEKDDAVFLLPTVIWCEDPNHPLASAEYMFPFVSVVQAPQEQLVDQMGYTLVGTAITEDETFIRELMASHNIERLNLGSIPTMHISWDQPHEGNLFEHLYRQRALQLAAM